MNCKPGDLALIVANTANRDRIVRVIDTYRCDPGEWRCEALQSIHEYVSIGLTGKILPPGSVVFAQDRHLRPLRDNDGTDEMLRIAGLPHKEHA